MIDFIVTLIIISILVFAILYIIREKKKGTKCIGCPYADSCKKGRSSTQKCGCK